MRKVIKITYKIVLCLFLLIFFSYAVIDSNIKNAILSICGITILALCAKKYVCYRHSNFDFMTPSILSGLTFASRYAYCNFMDDYISQVSDFAITLYGAQTGDFSDRINYYRFYLHKYLYPFILHLLQLTSQSRILLFQSICASACSFIIYCIGKKIANREIGILATLIYIIWPAQIVYTQIITEEHVAALLTSLIILSVICIVQRIESIKAIKSRSGTITIIESCIVGCLGGVCAFFKDWALVIFVAVGICAIYLLIIYGKMQRMLLVICLFCIVGFRGITQTVITCAAENELHVKANNGVIYVQMYATLDPNVGGGYNGKANEEYYKIAEENSYDFEKTNRIAMDILKEIIKCDYDKLPALLLRKGKDAYSNDSAMFWWALDVETGDEFKSKYPGFYSLIEYIDKVYYVGIVLCLMLSAILVQDKYNFFILLCILGGCMVSLLVESQGRYKYSIEPIWCISAAYGFYCLCKLKWSMIMHRCKLCSMERIKF